MRIGWSLKEAAAVLGIHERRVSQSLDPTLERIALLWISDATKTMTAILAVVEEKTQTRFEVELPKRIAHQCGGVCRE